MAHAKHPRLLYLALDARDASAAGATLASGGWEVTTCLSSAHALRILRGNDEVDTVAVHPKARGAVDVVVALANRASSSGSPAAACGVFVRLDGDTSQVPAFALRDRGIVGSGSLDDLVAIASAGRPRLLARDAKVTLTTVLRAAWLGRTNVAIHATLGHSGLEREIVMWIEAGTPVDARRGRSAAGIEALTPLVPGAAGYRGGTPDPIGLTAEYETTPPGASIAFGMSALLDLLDDDGPFVEFSEEELLASELWIDSAWSEPPPADAHPTAPHDEGALELVAKVGSVEGVLHAVAVDVGGAVLASLGTQQAGTAETLALWSAVAQSLTAAAIDDVVEGVVVSSERVIEVLRPLDQRILHVALTRETTNPALAWLEIDGICVS